MSSIYNCLIKRADTSLILLNLVPEKYTLLTIAVLLSCAAEYAIQPETSFTNAVTILGASALTFLFTKAIYKIAAQRRERAIEQGFINFTGGFEWTAELINK